MKFAGENSEQRMREATQIKVLILKMRMHQKRSEAGDRRPAMSLDSTTVRSVEQQIVDTAVARAERFPCNHDHAAMITIGNSEEARGIRRKRVIGRR